MKKGIHATIDLWSDPRCSAEIVRQHLANVVVMERACETPSTDVRFFCAHVVHCRYRVVFERQGGNAIHVLIKDRRSVTNRRNILENWSRGSADEGTLRLNPRDVFGGTERERPLHPLGGGKSGTPKFMSPDNSVVFKMMEPIEYDAWTGTFERDAGARFDERDERRSYLSRHFGVQSLYSVEKTSYALRSRWNVFTNVIPGGTNWFHPPDLMCDIKPQEMIGSVREPSDGGRLAYHLCRSIFAEGPAQIPVEMLVRRTRTTTWTSVDSVDGDAPEPMPRLTSANVQSIKIDLKRVLDKHHIVDYSWLFLIARPRNEEMIERLTSSLSPVAILESGHFVFVGLIDYLQPHTTRRKLESLVKSFRAISASDRPAINRNGFQVRAAAKMQAFKFNEYAQKQFLIASLYFACFDADVSARLWWEDITTAEFTGITRVCGSRYPIPITESRGRKDKTHALAIY